MLDKRSLLEVLSTDLNIPDGMYPVFSLVPPIDLNGGRPVFG